MTYAPLFKRRTCLCARRARPRRDRGGSPGGGARRPVRRMNRVAYVIGAAAQGFWRNPVMSLASTFTVTLMLLLFAFFLTTDRGLQAAVSVLESKVEIALFIDDNAKVSEILALKARIEADPAVSRVDYVTKEQALARLQEIADRRKDFVVASIDTNPLPASLEVKLSDARQAKRFGDELRTEVGGGVVADVN